MKIEAKDVLPNTNRTQADEMAEKCRFVPGTLTFDLDFKFVRASLPCEFGTNPFSGSRDISYTNKTKAKDVLPNKLHAAALCTPITPDSDGMVPSAVE